MDFTFFFNCETNWKWCWWDELSRAVAPCRMTVGLKQTTYLFSFVLVFFHLFIFLLCSCNFLKINRRKMLIILFNEFIVCLIKKRKMRRLQVNPIKKRCDWKASYPPWKMPNLNMLPALLAKRSDYAFATNEKLFLYITFILLSSHQ